MTTKARFIIFNSPPKLNTLLDHQTWLETDFSWHSTPAELGSPTAEPTPSWPEVPSILARDTTESQFQDAVDSPPTASALAVLPPSLPTSAQLPALSWEGARAQAASDASSVAGRSRIEQTTVAGVYANNVWGDADESSLAVYEGDSMWAVQRAQAEATVEDSFEAGTPWQGTQLLPAPRASHALPAPSQRSSRPPTSNILRGLTQPTPSYLNNETLSTEDDSGSFSFSDPALPPHLPWDHFSLRTLRSLRATLAKRSQGGSVAASVLGLVVDVQEVKVVGNAGKRRAGFAVEDGSGARASVVLWEEWVDSWAGVVRRGDVVFLGDVKLNLYNGALQAQPTHNPLSRAQICWRLVRLDEADDGYGFDPKWALTHPEAERVYKVVEFAQSAYKGAFEARGAYRG